MHVIPPNFRTFKKISFKFMSNGPPTRVMHVAPGPRLPLDDAWQWLGVESQLTIHTMLNQPRLVPLTATEALAVKERHRELSMMWLSALIEMPLPDLSSITSRPDLAAQFIVASYHLRSSLEPSPPTAWGVTQTWQTDLVSRTFGLWLREFPNSTVSEATIQKIVVNFFARLGGTQGKKKALQREAAAQGVRDLAAANQEVEDRLAKLTKEKAAVEEKKEALLEERRRWDAEFDLKHRVAEAQIANLGANANSNGANSNDNTITPEMFNYLLRRLSEHERHQGTGAAPSSSSSAHVGPRASDTGAAPSSSSSAQAGPRAPVTTSPAVPPELGELLKLHYRSTKK